MESYTPKNILITGGAGFIASHVVMKFVTSYPQYKIVNLDKLDYCSSLKNLGEINQAPNYKFIHGDILSIDLVRHILKSEQIDTILHFAAQSHVDNSFGNSLTFTQNNILGTHVLLEAAKEHRISRFIHVSTDEVYGEIHDIEGDATEERVLAPTNPYAATKAGSELLARAYYISFKLPVIITRGNNVYGPHQYPEKLIPKFICRLDQGKPCCIHGDGTHRRKFIYVSDVCSAFDVITHKGKVGEIYNIGTDQEFTTLQVARQLIAEFGLSDREHELIEYVEDRPFNDSRYSVDVSKLEQLGWNVQVPWEEGLRKTIEWYKQYRTNWANVEQALAPHPNEGKALTSSRADASLKM